MNASDFLKSFEEMIEVSPGSVQLTDSLADIAAWDSLAVVSFMAMSDEAYSASVTPSDLMNCKTVADLMELIRKGSR